MANTKKYVSLDKLGLYDEKIKGVISAGDTKALDDAKAYADGLAVNYEAAGAAATAESNAKGYTDGQISTVNTTVAGVKTIAEQGVADAATAQAAADKAQGEVDALEALVGVLPEGTTAKDVVDYVNIKTAGIATDAALGELQGQLSGVQGEVATIKGDYLKAADKTELEGKINAKAAQTDLDAVSAVANAAATQTALTEEVNRAKGEEGRIEGLVTAEAERAAGVESGLNTRLTEVETFFKTAEGETLDQALDTLVEIQTYITGEGAAADQMVLDIAANAKAIEDMDAAYKKADETLQGNIDTLTGVVNGKVAQGDFDTLSGKVTTAEGKISANEQAIAALQGEDTTIKGRIDALEGAIGESGSVADDIATAKQEAIDAAAVDATSKANAAESAAKGHADSLNTAMNTRVEALEAIDHSHANKSELDLIVTGDKAKWDAAAAKAHEHSNLAVLEGITSAKVTAWDNAEGNAKTYADGLNTAMDTRVVALETWHTNFTECSEDEINALFA